MPPLLKPESTRLPPLGEDVFYGCSLNENNITIESMKPHWENCYSYPINSYIDSIYTAYILGECTKLLRIRLVR